MKDPGMLFYHCVCTWQPVQVVHGDGRVRRLAHPITVGELLECHPHHFVCEPSSNGPLYHTGMLPLDMELEEGRVYLLLPLPRLLPHLANTFTKPPSCPCFSKRDTRTVAPHSISSPAAECEASTVQTMNGDSGEKKFEDSSRVRKWFSKNQRQVFAAAKCAQTFQQRARLKLMRSFIHTTTRLLPERLRSRILFDKLEDPATKQSSHMGRSLQCTRNRWRPGLECISEVELLAGLLKDSAQIGITDR